MVRTRMSRAVTIIPSSVMYGEKQNRQTDRDTQSVTEQSKSRSQQSDTRSIVRASIKIKFRYAAAVLRIFVKSSEATKTRQSRMCGNKISSTLHPRNMNSGS